MSSQTLLHDFLTTDLPLTELAHRHSLSLEQLIAWADSPETTRLFDDLQRIAAKRSALIAAESSAQALGNLAHLSFALARRSELANAATQSGAATEPHAAPKPPSITALETSRKACSALLRLFPARSHLSPVLKPTREPPHARTQDHADLSAAAAPKATTDTPRKLRTPTPAAATGEPLTPAASSSPTLPSPVHILTCSPVPATLSHLHPSIPSPIHAASRLASLAGTVPARHSGMSSTPDPRFQSPSIAGISTG